MKTNQHPFTGLWFVAFQEARNAGKWEREYDFAPGEWIIAFTPTGNYVEIFHPGEEDRCIYDWALDERTGVISVVLPEKPETVIEKYVFADGFLYRYDDMPHIPGNAQAIVEHHAHLRQKLTKVGKSESSSVK